MRPDCDPAHTGTNFINWGRRAVRCARGHMGWGESLIGIEFHFIVGGSP